MPAQLPTYLHVKDVQGLAQLATQGVLGVAGLAESVQGNVYKMVAAPFGPLGDRFINRLPGSSGIKPMGITALVYGGVKGITRLAGGSVNAVLAAAAPMVKPQASSPVREAMLAALNGVLGDQLLATANPLAIGMRVRVGGQALALNKAALAQALPGATGRIALLVHGLCMHDGQWPAAAQGASIESSPSSAPGGHAEALQSIGYTPVYLHYNTGLHTSTNGEQLSHLLTQLVDAWPQPVTDLSLVVHSMGGLVARSACAHAEGAGAPWRQQLKNIVFLGTPHHGAPLEQVGHWVDTILGSNRVTRPFAQIGQIRSSGITDLRHGYVLAAHWQDQDRFERQDPEALAQRQPLPLPSGVACFTVAATTAKLPRALSGSLPGDKLVPVNSALGVLDGAVPDASALNLHFPDEHQLLAYATDHLALLKSPQVSAQLVKWLGSAPARPA